MTKHCVKKDTFSVFYTNSSYSQIFLPTNKVNK